MNVSGHVHPIPRRVIPYLPALRVLAYSITMVWGWSSQLPQTINARILVILGNDIEYLIDPNLDEFTILNNYIIAHGY